MKTNEDHAFETRRQARIDAENWDSNTSIPIHQKIGTVIPFSRTVDRDPNPRIPLTVPEPVMKITKLEAAIWLAVVGAWLAYLIFGTGAR
jgi:hypothetical protein